MKNLIKWVFLVIFLATSLVSADGDGYSEKMGLLECLEFALENHADLELARFAILEAEFALEKLEMDDPRGVAAKDLLAKKQDLKKAKEALVETGMKLALQVETKYYQVLKTIATINNKKDSREWAEKQLAIAEVKYTNGLISKKEHTAIAKRVVETEKEYADARFNLETVRMEMNLALGRDLAQFFQLKEQEFPYQSMEINLTEATQYALKHGKNIQKASENLAEAQENLEFKIASESAQIEIIKFKQKLKAAEIKLKQIEAETIIELRNAYIGFRSAEDMIRDAENTYVQASEELEVLSIKYEAGMVSLIELMDGQRELSAAEVELIQTIYDYNLAKAAFNQSSGKGYSLYQQIVQKGSDD